MNMEMSLLDDVVVLSPRSKDIFDVGWVISRLSATSK